MSNVKYTLESGKVYADFAERKKVEWEGRWVPSEETIVSDDDTVLLAKGAQLKVLSILGVDKAPEVVEQFGIVDPNSVFLTAQMSNGTEDVVRATNVICDTSVQGTVTGTAYYGNTGKATFDIFVTVPSK